MFKLFENEEYTNLNYRSLKMKDVTDLIKKINEMFKEGYVIDENFSTKDCPKIPIVYNLKFVKKFYHLDSLTKKDDMIEYAKTQGIEVPENLTRPLSVKKFIKEKLEG